MSEHDDDTETIKCGEGITIHIKRDPDPQNPRTEFDCHLSVMAAWHRNYNLGDGTEQRVGKHGKAWQPVHADQIEMWRELFREMKPTERQLLPAIRVALQDKSMRDDYEGWTENQTSKEAREGWSDTVLEWLREESSATREFRVEVANVLTGMGLVIKPLFLYDHSGITISTGRFSCPWDSGQVGYVYVTPAKIEEEYPGKKLSDVVDTEDGKPLTLRDRINKIIDGEVEEYDQYLTGEIYGYVITRTKEDGEDDDSEDELNSCWGFFGEKCAIEEAKSIAENYVEQYQDPARMAGADI